MYIPRYLLFAGFSSALVFSIAGCKSGAPANTQAQQDQSQIQNPAQDPADVNVAPIPNATQASYQQGAPPAPYAPREGYPPSPNYTAPARRGDRSDRYARDRYRSDQEDNYEAGHSTQDQANYYGDYNNPDYYNNYDNYDQPVEYADQAPPPLPEYDQPPCPGEGYIWTPGYWNYASSEGYYWVPGAWVSAPYQGALWTPGYWSYNRGRYGWHRGFWGRHVGYYGGLDYGHGYDGYGYQGGYWNGDRFDYNRAVNNVNTTVIQNVYNYRVVNQTVNRVSYNGPGGVQVKPRPAEVAAWHEEHNAPMSTQLQHAQQAEQIRQNFAKVNHGRPQVVATPQPLPADRNIKPPAPVPMKRLVPTTNNAKAVQPPRPGQPTGAVTPTVPSGANRNPQPSQPPSSGLGRAVQPATQPHMNGPGNSTTAQGSAQPYRNLPSAAPMTTHPSPEPTAPRRQEQQQPAPVQHAQRQASPQQTQPAQPTREPQHTTPPPRTVPAPQRMEQQQRPATVQQPQRQQPAPERQAPQQHANPAPDRQAPQRANPGPARQAPQQHADRAPDRQAPANPRPAPAQRPEPVPQRPSPVPQQSRPQLPPQSHAQEHRQGPPAKQDEKDKKPH